jgi:hypothetical protein
LAGFLVGIGALRKIPVQLIVKLPRVGWPPKLAVITAVPTVKGVTTPVSLTVATAGFEETKFKKAGAIVTD